MSEEISKQQNLQTSHLDTEDEIDLLALAKTVWRGKKIIILVAIIFTLIGLFIANFTPKQYLSSTIIIPHMQVEKRNLGGIYSMAAMAGINLNSSSGNGLSPRIYPQIIKSIPFQKELMHVKLNFNGYEEKISLFDYYTDPKYSKFNILNFVKEYTIGLPSKIINLPSNIIGLIRGKEKIQNQFANTDKSLEVDINIIQLSEKERALIGLLNTSISLQFNKEGTISITAIMPEAKAAAQLGAKSQAILQKEIIKFNIAKSNEQLRFIQDRYNEKKKEFLVVQTKRALFLDRNKNITTSIAQVERERLQNEYQLVFTLYSELAKQLENSKIQVKKETPIFSILEPFSVPLNNIKPNKIEIVLIWLFLGGIVGIGWVFGKEYLKTLRKKWNNL